MAYRKNVLVLDDTPLNLELMQNIIEIIKTNTYPDLNVYPFSTGDAIIEYVKKYREKLKGDSLYIMDILVPGIDGITATKIIKELDPTAIFISYGANYEELIKARLVDEKSKELFAANLPKPCSVDHALQIIHNKLLKESHV